MRRPLRKKSDRSHDSNMKPQKWWCKTDECVKAQSLPIELFFSFF